MWEVSRRTRELALAAFLLLAFGGVEASAQTNVINQNISGFNLPGVQLSTGSDEVRAADGTTCRSAVGGSGAYMDIGVIGNPETDASDASFSAYGRIVVPLGEKPRRVDCTRLYDLEIARLEMELKLAQMGLAQGISPVTEEGYSSNDSGDDFETNATEEPVTKVADKAPSKKNDEPTAAWIEDGWSTEGLKKKK